MQMFPKKTKMDVLRRGLCRSDSLISGYRKKSSSKKKPFDLEVIQLLIPPLFPVTS